MATICLHHNDRDGRCAAAVIKKAVGGAVHLVGISYDHQDEMLKGIKPGDKVIVADLALSEDKFTELLDITRDVVYIDHHKSTVEKLKDIMGNYGIANTIEIGNGGACKLAWKHYMHDAEVPEAVNLISNYDEGHFKYGDRVMLFALGVQVMDLNPSSALWNVLLERGIRSQKDAKMVINNTINSGYSVLKYQENQAYSLRNKAYITTLDGIPCTAVNNDIDNLVLRKTRFNTDLLVIYSYCKDKWSISLYCDSGNIDVSTIAKKYGGGGHVNSAGFYCQELPFKN